MRAITKFFKRREIERVKAGVRFVLVEASSNAPSYIYPKDALTDGLRDLAGEHDSQVLYSTAQAEYLRSLANVIDSLSALGWSFEDAEASPFDDTNSIDSDNLEPSKPNATYQLVAYKDFGSKTDLKADLEQAGALKQFSSPDENQVSEVFWNEQWLPLAELSSET